MKGPSVVIGMPVGSGSIPWPTAVSLMATVRALDRANIPVKIEAPVGCSVVQWARSAVAHSFITTTDFTHLFWVDSDMAFAPSDFLRLLGFGAVLDVVCGAYPLKKDPPGFLINLPGGNETTEREVNGMGCVKIASTGLGFTLVKRAVIEKLWAASPLVHDRLNGCEYRDMFRVDRTSKNGPRGEDVAFFDDVRAAEYDVWLDPSVRLGHVGQKTYKGDPVAELGLEDYAKDEEKAA